MDTASVSNPVLHYIPIPLIISSRFIIFPFLIFIGQLISGLQVARLRKEVQSYGHEWPLAKEAKNPPVKFKGSKHLIKKKARADNIKAAMAEMPKKIADYYKQMRERRQHPLDLLSVIQSAGNPQGK